MLPTLFPTHELLWDAAAAFCICCGRAQLLFPTEKSRAVLSHDTAACVRWRDPRKRGNEAVQEMGAGREEQLVASCFFACAQGGHEARLSASPTAAAAQDPHFPLIQDSELASLQPPPGSGSPPTSPSPEGRDLHRPIKMPLRLSTLYQLLPWQQAQGAHHQCTWYREKLWGVGGEDALSPEALGVVSTSSWIPA